MNILVSAGRWLLAILLYIGTLMRAEIKKLAFAAKFVEKGFVSRDFVDIFRPTRLFFTFNVLALLIFLFLPQGQDVLLIVIEDLSVYKPFPLFSLLFGLTAWSVVAEFGARYKLYISDNSGFSLSAERVEYRKQLQRFFSMLYLMMPFIIVLVGLLVVSFTSIRKWELAIIWPFVVTIFLIVWLLKLLSRFYLDPTYRARFVKRFPVLAGKLKLPDHELKHAERLLGIYNAYVLRIRKGTFFQAGKDDTTRQVSGQYLNFENSVLAQHIYRSEDKKGFPDQFIIDTDKPDLEHLFEDPEYRDEYTLNYQDQTRSRDMYGAHRWLYKLKRSAFRVLHFQLLLISVLSLVTLLLVPSRFNLIPTLIGSPGLVCLSFAAWQGLYIGLMFLDAHPYNPIPFSIRWALLILLLLFSYFNSDHPLRTLDGAQHIDRPAVTDHFLAWKKDHERTIYALRDGKDSVWWQNRIVADTAGQRDSTLKANSRRAAAAKDSMYPVIFITAEGGALRTGAFTAMLLAALQDSFQRFSRDIYAFSSVSGGTVGVSFFNALAYLTPPDGARPDSGYFSAKTKEFFTKDQLSPVLSKLFFGDPLSSLSPWPIPNYDRAIGLEKSWENDYNEVFRLQTDKNVYSSDFMDGYRDTVHPHPAWFINTTEVESGLQCFVSNVRPRGFLMDDRRDLLGDRLRCGVRYSTAVNLSCRFPIFSPSGAVKLDDDRTYHYIDGGYVENTGAKTMLELLQQLKKDSALRYIKPYVIQLRFGPSGEFRSTKFLNEITSILSGIYNIRAGYSETYTQLLHQFTDSLGGKFIQVALPATSSEVPMSWVLSDRSINNLQQQIDKLMRNATGPDHKANQLHDLYWFHPAVKRKIDTLRVKLVK